MEPYIQAGYVNTIDLTACEEASPQIPKLNGDAGAEMAGQWGELNLDTAPPEDQLKAKEGLEFEESGEEARENQGRG